MGKSANFKIAVLKSGLAAFFDCGIRKIEKLPLGLTNENYNCTLENGDQYVVRMPGRGSELLVSRDDELEVLQKVSELGIDVDFVFFDAKKGIKISRYVQECCPLSRDHRNYIESAINLLRKLHYSGIDLKVDFGYWEKMESYFFTANRLSITLECDFGTLYKRLYSLNTGLPTPETRIPSHNDPVPDNFLCLKTGEVLLIDWEYGGMNDPTWDLASFSLEFELSESDEKSLLKMYFDEVSESIHSRILLNKVQQDFLWYLWSKIKTHFGQDLSLYAKTRYARGLTNFKKLVSK